MAMILDAFLSKFSEILVQMVHDEVDVLLGIRGQIEKLGETVRDIQCVLADAERKQSKGNVIERWLMQIKDVMYDADDVIDLCQIKSKGRLAGSSSRSCTSCASLLFCLRNPLFAHEIGSKIKDINLRLEGIAKRKANLGLIAAQIIHEPSDRVHRVVRINNRKTDPLVVQDDIVGEKIEEDTKLLVNWLTEEEKGVRSELVCIAAIVGMGGIGKTTLAKKIFNDQRIEEEFHLKIWVCVSKEVQEEELLKCVIREARGEYGAAQERSELAPLLKSLVQRKKFLLVLDDVWEESCAIWDGLLRAPMSSGAHGSRLLVTTRDVRVANGMKAAKLHHVQKLSVDDGWSLLIKQVVENEEEISEIQEFKDIGLQLVEKCDGLPLAIKSIGGVLCTKGNKRSKWEAVLTSDVWSMDMPLEDVHHAFYLSYEDLPSPLKRCFIYCSLFPEDFKFERTYLIYMWQAEGFLQDKGEFWELGNKYYTELLLRNFLEDTENLYDQEECKMHDLLWSFARQLGKDENYVLREGQVLSRPEGSLKIRRLSIEGNEVNTKLIKNENGLRTLFLCGKPEIGLDDLCKVFANLRLLDLSFSNFSNLPDSLCDLVHLRYLNVNGSKIRNLPNSIKNLKYLVYLNLGNCKNLSHVPPSIMDLQELRYLSTINTAVKAFPAGLNKLEKLVQLCGFKPHKNSLEGFSSLEGIETLSQLIDLLIISLEEVSDKSIAKRANLQNKDCLQALKLVYGKLSSEEQLSQTNEKKMITEDVLNELCPPRSLEIVQIVGYFGSHLPNWLNLRVNLPNLRYIDIENCACFEELALLGQLPNLDFLRIIGAYSVVSVGEEFLWGGIQNRDTIATSCHVNKSAFPKLSKLIFERMPNWKEWEWNKEQVAMPKLKNLFIRDCPQLISLPEGLLHHATSLEYLEIDGANKLITVENLPSIKDIRVFESPNLERISNLPSISYILIEECPNLKAVENLKALQTMLLVDFNMEILPDYLRITMPQKLRIRCSEELLVKIVSQGESGSEWNKFKHIPKVTIYSSGESFYATYLKTPFSFTTNVSTRSVDSVQRCEMMSQQE